jgi:hypothetical protein
MIAAAILDVLLGLLSFGFFVLAFPAFLMMFSSPDSKALKDKLPLYVAAELGKFAVTALGACLFVAGIGLLARKLWARSLTLICAFLFVGYHLFYLGYQMLVVLPTVRPFAHSDLLADAAAGVHVISGVFIVSGMVLATLMMANPVDALSWQPPPPPPPPDPALTTPNPNRVFLGLAVAAEGNGCRVVSLAESSPAATAGLLLDDLLAEFDGWPLESAEHLYRLLYRKFPGDAACFTVIRGDRSFAIDVTLGKRQKR